MPNRIWLLLLTPFLWAAKCETPVAKPLVPGKVIEHKGHRLGIYNFEQLSPLFERQNDTTYIINFWATWCKPCLEELPAFTQAAEKFAGEKVQFFFVSLDMPRHLKSRLIPYLNQNPLPGKVLVLDDVNMNEWIPKVDEDWGGAIPVTYVYRGKQNWFHEGMVEFATLQNVVENIKSD